MYVIKQSNDVLTIVSCETTYEGLDDAKVAALDYANRNLDVQFTVCELVEVGHAKATSAKYVKVK